MGLPSRLLAVLAKERDDEFTYSLLDCFKIIILHGTDQTVFGFVDENLEFLDFMLKCMRKKGYIQRNLLCLLVLNKLLGLDSVVRGGCLYQGHILESEFLYKLEMLQSHQDDHVYSLAEKIIDEFFDSDEVDED